MARINWQSLRDKSKQLYIAKAREILTAEEFKQIKLIQDGYEISFKGPGEIVEKFKNGLRK